MRDEKRKFMKINSFKRTSNIGENNIKIQQKIDDVSYEIVYHKTTPIKIDTAY